MSRDRRRESATIRSVSSKMEDHHGEHWEIWVHLDYDEGMSQGFGGLWLDEKSAKLYEKELCTTFGVKRLQDLVGKKCMALKNFSKFNETIEGLEEHPRGRRFTHLGFQTRHYPNAAKDRLQQRTENLRAELRRLKERVTETMNELAGLEDDYIDWEKAP